MNAQSACVLLGVAVDEMGIPAWPTGLYRGGEAATASGEGDLAGALLTLRNGKLLVAARTRVSQHCQHADRLHADARIQSKSS